MFKMCLEKKRYKPSIYTEPQQPKTIDDTNVVCEVIYWAGRKGSPRRKTGSRQKKNRKPVFQGLRFCG